MPTRHAKIKARSNSNIRLRARRPSVAPSAGQVPLQRKTKVIFSRLRKHHSDATIELNFSNPLELTVATILSAQCTDTKVNEVTATLFKRLRKAADYIAIRQEDLEGLIKQTGFFRQKAKSIKRAMEMIAAKHRGKVPQTMEELVELPGVGRKTANVILGNAFGIPGLPVDTHVMRVSKRLGLTESEDPVKIEAELCAMLPPKDWTLFSHTLISHGRRICKARRPLCEQCPVRELCDFWVNVVQPRDE